jgi:large subunit ribosomal protein L4
MIVDVFNLEKQKVGELELDDAVYAAAVKPHLMHEVVRSQLVSRRSGTACAKERNAVSGGGKKPYRQKGTGRARQGSRRAPNHVGGGKAFGPRPRSYAFRPTRKVRKGALRSALSLYAKEQRLLVLEAFELEAIGTGRLARILAGLDVDRALLVDGRENEKLRLSARNLRDHQFLPPEGVNVYDLLRHERLVMTKQAALRVQEALTRARGGRS